MWHGRNLHSNLAHWRLDSITAEAQLERVEQRLAQVRATLPRNGPLLEALEARRDRLKALIASTELHGYITKTARR